MSPPIHFQRFQQNQRHSDSKENHDQTNHRWEGVTMYLTSDAVNGTLDFIRSSTAAESIVVFDYIYASVLRRENRFYGEKEIFDTVSRTGESWTFGVEEGKIEHFLSERGFTVLCHHTPTDLKTAYLTADDGALFGRINGTHAIVVASVQKHRHELIEMNEA